jgi:DNA polymerase III sliding clamp (beta) subunit (PCNA family)
LTEGLNLFREDNVTMELKDSNTGVIVHEGDKDTFFFLVMPLEV